MRQLLVLPWIVLAWPVYCQSGFNEIYDLGYYQNQFHNLIAQNDTIIGYGRAYSNLPPNKQCLFIARFDSIGIPIDNQLICDPLGGHLTMAINWSEIIITSDGGYAITGAAFDRHNGIFVKLRKDLSVEFFKEYPDSVNLVEFYNSIVELPDGYLLGGYVQSPNYLAEPFLRRVDKQGNSLWFKYYGKYAVFDSFSNYTKLNDSTVVYVGGYILNESTLSGRGPWIVTVNPFNGKVIQEWRPTNSILEYLHYIHPLPMGNWLVYGKKAFQVNPTRVRPFWAVLDSNFNLIDMRLFGPGPLISNFIWDIEPTPDGNFIAAGELYAANPNTEPADIYGWLYKVSPELDSLWSLQLIAPVPEPKVSGNYLGGAGVLSSGNMVAGGYSTYNSQITCWLVKFSTDGCVDTIWCAVTPDWEPDEPEIQPRQLRLYPNPAQETVFVELPEGDYPVWVELYTMDSRLLQRQKLESNEAVKIAGLPQGIYLCRVIDASGLIYIAKLIVSASF